MVISIAMRKGGVGKTSTVANLAGLMAQEGKRVLIVDTDSQGNCTDVMTGYDVFSRHFEKKGLFEMLRFYGALDAAGFVSPTNVEGVDIIPANGQTPKAPEQIRLLADGGEYSQNMFLAACLADIADSYDYILIDTAPGDDLLLHNALIASDYVIVPLKLDDYWRSSLNWTKATCEALEKEEETVIPILGVFYTMTERVTQAKMLREEVAASEFGPLMFECEIRKNQAANDMTTYKLPAVICAKTSNVAKDYRALYEEIKARIAEDQADGEAE